MASDLPLQDREDRRCGILRCRVGRVDLVHEGKSIDCLLQDNSDRLGLHVLPDLLRRPSPRPEPRMQNRWPASKDEGEVYVHPMAVMAPQERDLGRNAKAL